MRVTVSEASRLRSSSFRVNDHPMPGPPQPNERFAVAGQEVRWGRWGAGPPVVFCHGTPWSSALWAPSPTRCAPTTPSTCGTCPATAPPRWPTARTSRWPRRGRYFADLLGYWELAEPHVVAHDYGGAVALRAHLLHGARYRSLALVDVVALAPWGSEFFRLVGAHAEVFAQLPPSLHEALVRAYITRRRAPPAAGRGPGHAHRAVAGRPRPGGVLPPDRPGRPALHRRDRAAVPDARPARAGGVGHRGHLDPGRPRAPARRADPRRPAGPRARRGAPASSSTRPSTSRPCWRAGWRSGSSSDALRRGTLSVSWRSRTSAARAVGLAPLLAVCCGYFMVILDVTIVNVAAPAIGRDLGASLTDLQWIVDGYTVAFAGPAAPRRGAGRPLGPPPRVLPRGGRVHRLVPRLRRRGRRPRAHGVPARSRAAAPPCWCPARWPCCSRSTARRRPGRGPSGCGARSRAWRPPRARSWAGC